MTMMLPEALEGGSSSDTGLSLGQKGSALNRLLPKPKTQHPYVVGLSLVLIGGFALVGSITGTLPSMLAALFDPNALVDTKGNTPLAVIADPSQTGSPSALPDTAIGTGSASAINGVPTLKLPDIPLPELPVP